MRIGWIQLYYERYFCGIEKKIKEELGFRCLEVDAIGYLVVHLYGKKLLDF